MHAQALITQGRIDPALNNLAGYLAIVNAVTHTNNEILNTGNHADLLLQRHASDLYYHDFRALVTDGEQIAVFGWRVNSEGTSLYTPDQDGITFAQEPFSNSRYYFYDGEKLIACSQEVMIRYLETAKDEGHN